MIKLVGGVVVRLTTCLALCALLLCAQVASAGTDTEITFSIADLGLDQWEYTYDVTNISLTVEIEEFTIWFGFGDYDNLAIETLDPPASNWDEIVWQPEPVIGDDGGYDALATGLNIGIGETVSGFAVSFDWLGVGEPGPQYYEVIDPITFDTLDSGWTVPEPSTIALISLGSLLSLKRTSRKMK